MNKISYDRAILDAIPLAIFVVDADVRIRDLNAAASAIFALEKGAILNRRGGEVLHCLYSHDVPEGCGRGPACQDCAIRDSVRHCLRGKSVSRRRMKAEFTVKGITKQLELLITASPMTGDGEFLVLLILEDISEISTLRAMIPICAACKKIRDDQQYWRSVESYFSAYAGVDFSHGLCPDCVNRLYPELRNSLTR